MEEFLKVGMIVAFKIEDHAIRKKVFWIAGEIKEIRKTSYLVKVAFNTNMPFRFDEIIDTKVLEH